MLLVKFSSFIGGTLLACAGEAEMFTDDTFVVRFSMMLESISLPEFNSSSSD